LEVSSQNFTDVEICSTIITSGLQCTTPNYPGCNDEDGCDHCGTYCTPIDVMTEVCWTFTVGDGGGETGTGTSPGGNAPPPPGSGGGGSGSGIPPADPCNNTPDNPTEPYTAQSNVVDPGNCPPPTGGPGWVPIPIEPPPVGPPTDSIPTNISRACDKEMDSLYQWGMNNQFREQSFIIVKKNGSIYPKNFMHGFPGGDKTRVNYTLEAGEELLAYVHIHAEDTVNFYRSSFSPDDLIEFNSHANFVGYTAIVEVGNARYAFVLEDVQKKSNFNISKMGQHKKLFNAKFNTLTSQYPNGQTCSEQTWIQYLGSASVSGIGFYKATSPHKNNYIKLNP